MPPTHHFLDAECFPEPQGELIRALKSCLSLVGSPLTVLLLFFSESQEKTIAKALRLHLLGRDAALDKASYLQNHFIWATTTAKQISAHDELPVVKGLEPHRKMVPNPNGYGSLRAHHLR